MIIIIFDNFECVAVQRVHELDKGVSIPIPGPDVLLDLKKLYKP